MELKWHKLQNDLSLLKPIYLENSAEHSAPESDRLVLQLQLP